MAKKYYKAPVHQTGRPITTKTHFGSTRDMVIDHSGYILDGKPIQLAENEVVCKDDGGFYITLSSRIDSGLADPNRYDNAKNRINIVEQTNSSA